MGIRKLSAPERTDEEMKQMKIDFTKKRMKGVYLNYIDENFDDFISKIDEDEMLKFEINLIQKYVSLFKEVAEYDLFNSAKIKETPEYKKAIMEIRL